MIASIGVPNILVETSRFEEMSCLRWTLLCEDCDWPWWPLAARKVAPMSQVIDVLKADFFGVNSIETLWAFQAKHGLVKDGVPRAPSQIYGVTIGAVEGVAVRVTHRWYDPSGPYQNLPDISKVLLELDGVRVDEIAFEERD